VKLELNLRSYTTRIARGAALAAGVPDDRSPVATVLQSEYAPALYNDPALTSRLTQVFVRELGPEVVETRPAVMASEDFGRLGLNGQIPIFMFRVGAVDPAAFAQANAQNKEVPTLHSPSLLHYLRPPFVPV
jgi:hippurate hydrolase